MVTSLFKKNKEIFKKGQAALPVILVIGGIIALIGTSLSLRSFLEQKAILSDKASKEALIAAESGINDALMRLSRDKTLDTSYELTISNTTKVDVTISKNKPSFNQTTIVSLGSSNQAQRELQCTVQIDAPTGALKLVSCQEIALSAAGDTTSPTVGLISPTNATATQAIVLSSSVSDNSAIRSCNLFINNLDQGAMSLSQSPCASCVASKTYTFTSSGSYGAYVKCYDLVGNSATSTTVTISVVSSCSAPTAGTVTPANTSYGSYVDSPFDLSTDFTSDCAISSCQYTIDGSTWYSATVSGSAPNYTCSQTGISCSDGQSLTLNMRATNTAGTTTATSVTRTCDATGPTCSDNWTDNWTATSPVTVTISSSDARSGVATTKYCIDTANSCYPATAGTSASVSCASGQCCTQYVRYAAWDNVGNASSIYSKRVRQDLQAPNNGTLTATAGSTQCALSWSGFSDSGSGLATSNTYKLVYATGSTPSSCSAGTQIYLGTGTSYTHTGLTNGTTYYYRVCAYDALGNISTGATASCTPNCTCTAWSSWSNVGCGVSPCTAGYMKQQQTRTCTPSGCAAEVQTQCVSDTCTSWSSCGGCTPASGSCTCTGTQTCQASTYGCLVNTTQSCTYTSPNGTVCRPAANECDVAETCSNGVCPSNSYVAAGTQCTDTNTSDCYDAKCNGSGTCSQTYGYESSSYVCRPAVGVCDIAEYCTGTSGTCPTDTYRSSGDWSTCTATCKACNGTKTDTCTLALTADNGPNCTAPCNKCSSGSCVLRSAGDRTECASCYKCDGTHTYCVDTGCIDICYGGTFFMCNAQNACGARTCTLDCCSDDPACDYNCTDSTCLLAGTKITLPNGLYKNIEEIKVGDKVLAFDFKNYRIIITNVLKVKHHLPQEMATDYYLVINNLLKLTPNHKLDRPDGQSVFAGDLKVGDILMGEEGLITIKSIEKVYQKVPTFDLVTESGHYFVDGFSDLIK